MERQGGDLISNAHTAASSLSRFAFSRLSLKVKIIIISVSTLLLVVFALAGSSSMSQLNDIYYLTPKGEEESIRPDADIKEKALYDISYAREKTDTLLNIIDAYKKEDKENQIEAIKTTCNKNGWDIERSLNMLTGEFDEASSFLGLSNRILAAFSVSLDNGQLVKTGLSYTNQAGKPVKTFLFGMHKGEIDYERTLSEDIRNYLKTNHFYILTYEKENGQIKIYEDVEVEYEAEEIDVLDEKGKPTGKKEVIYVSVYYYYYYVHPVLIEQDLGSIAEEIFGIDMEAPYVNSICHDGVATVGERGVISNREAISRIAEATEELLYGRSDYISRYYYSSLSGTYEWPAPGNMTITSLWGPRVHPITGKYTNHLGTDIAGFNGDPVVAAEEGLVIFAGVYGTYGNLIKLLHSDGNVTYYGHLSKILVSEGKEVERGEEIGKIGSTGRSTGPHLHFEVRINGETVDPIPWVCTEDLYSSLTF